MSQAFNVNGELYMLNNEEDVKNKLVVPYLRSLGFDESELSYEKSFNLKVGRYTYRIDTNEQVRTMPYRLLCSGAVWRKDLLSEAFAFLLAPSNLSGFSS